MSYSHEKKNASQPLSQPHWHQAIQLEILNGHLNCDNNCSNCDKQQSTSCDSRVDYRMCMCVGVC